MPLTNAARDLICQAIIGAAYTAFNNANSYLSVGDSATAFATSQTELQAVANRLRKAMTATYPQVSTNVITFRASFGSAEANWHWQEVGVFNAVGAGGPPVTGGTMLFRAVQDLGTKTAGSTWDLTTTETITV
jgi:hypothetical protein